jgi:[NiFe] hydrogenase assembly HybE family chaperone
MNAAHVEGSFLGDLARIAPETKLECGVCWWVYDPLVGDDVLQIAPGVAFAHLPTHWRCPKCDSEKHPFMGLGQGQALERRRERNAVALAMEKRVRDLTEAYARVAERIAALPVYNEKLEFEVLGFSRWKDAFVGVVSTPWCMNLVRLPIDEAAEIGPEGAKRRHTLPSVSYAFIIGRLPGFGALESALLFSPMGAFDDPRVARLVVEHAIDGAFAPAEPAPAATSADSAARSELSRRRFFGAAAS